MKRVLDYLVLLACLSSAIAAVFGGTVAEAQTADGAEAQSIPDASRAPFHDTADRGPSEAIYPPQRITIRFSHVKHMTLSGMSCVSCHAGAKTSTLSSDRILPDPKVCDSCHGSDHEDLAAVNAGPGVMGACGSCHMGFREEEGSRVMPFVMPKPNLHFSHKAHFDRNIGCAQCHGAVEKLELATRNQLPRMQGCMGCHEMPEPAKGGAKSECATCHLTRVDGTLRTTFPSGTLTPPQWLQGAEHTADFLIRHRFAAAENAKLCSSCHQEDFCVACHDGRVRPRGFHPNDWLSMHSVAAEQDRPRCTSCHNQQSFCLSCHQRAGVAMSGPNQVHGFTRSHFHPPGWADFGARGRGHHGWEAMRNLNACVSCHTERDCAMCHAAPGRRGLGMNPHGPGFISRCKTALRRNVRPCLVCHESNAPELGLCR